MDAKERCIDEEEEESLVVVEAKASGKPRTMVVHLQDTGAARGAMVGAIWLLELALFAVTILSIRFYGDGRGVGGYFGGGEVRVTVLLYGS